MYLTPHSLPHPNRRQWISSTWPWLDMDFLSHPSSFPWESSSISSEPKNKQHFPIHHISDDQTIKWLNAFSLSSQEFKLPTDHAPQKPLLLLRSELSDHHHPADGSGQQLWDGAEESSRFTPVGWCCGSSFVCCCCCCRCVFSRLSSSFRPAVRSPSSSTSTCLAVTTSGCCVRESTSTLWSWWRCLLRNSTSCGTTFSAGVRSDVAVHHRLYCSGSFFFTLIWRSTSVLTISSFIFQGFHSFLQRSTPSLEATTTTTSRFCTKVY